MTGLEIWIIIVFCVGYLGIIFEHSIKINKTATALFLAVILWIIYFSGSHQLLNVDLQSLDHKLGDVSQILFFLLGAMTLVELIDSHKGFDIVVHKLHANSRKILLWIIAAVSFVLSAILDNLTTSILMISILRKLIPRRQDRFIFSCVIIVAANAGGAWTPIGDVTTTMLWINGQLSTMAVVKAVFFPSVVSLLVPLMWFTHKMKDEKLTTQPIIKSDKLEPGAKPIFILGIAGFLFVPVFRWLTGMPPYMGMLISVSVMWAVTDLLHHRHEQRAHLRIPQILKKVDVTSILFFLGILLSIDSLEVSGLLKKLAVFMSENIGSLPVIATIIGILSAIIDNVPLVAATMGMYDLTVYPMDSELWLLIAYAAGTGGSMLVIGSSAGVALMSLEKINFITYLKKITLPVFVGFLLGILVYVYL